MAKPFSIVKRLSRLYRRAEKAAAKDVLVEGVVVSVHRFQYGSRDVLVDCGGQKRWLFVPWNAAVGDLSAGDRLSVQAHVLGDTCTAAA